MKFKIGDRVIHPTMNSHGSVRETFANNKGNRFYYIDWYDMKLSGASVPIHEDWIEIDSDYYNQLKIDNRDELIDKIVDGI